MQEPEENREGQSFFESLQSIVENAEARAKREQILKCMQDLRQIYETAVESGFSDNQAMALVVTIVGKSLGKGAT